MPQWLKASAALPENMGLVPNTAASSSQLSVTSASGGLTAFCHPPRALHTTRGGYTYIQADKNTHI